MSGFFHMTSTIVFDEEPKLYQRQVIARYVGLFSYDICQRILSQNLAFGTSSDCPLCRAFFI